MSFDLKFVELMGDVLENIFYKIARTAPLHENSSLARYKIFSTGVASCTVLFCTVGTVTAGGGSSRYRYHGK